MLDTATIIRKNARILNIGFHIQKLPVSKPHKLTLAFGMINALTSIYPIKNIAHLFLNGFKLPSYIAHRLRARANAVAIKSLGSNIINPLQSNNGIATIPKHIRVTLFILNLQLPMCHSLLLPPNIRQRHPLMLVSFLLLRQIPMFHL